MIAVQVDVAFTIIFAALAIPLTVVELYGVARRQRGDTISENVWWVQRRWPWARYVIGGFLIWLFAHFMWGGS